MYFGGKNQEPKLQWSSKTGREKQEKDGRAKFLSRRVWKKKDLKLENRPFTTLKDSSIPFLLNTPHQVMRHKPPNIAILRWELNLP